MTFHLLLLLLLLLLLFGSQLIINIDNIIKNIVCVFFYDYIFDFITHFLFVLLIDNFL